MNKRGMSAIIATLIIILLVIVAVGIVWVVVKNILDKGKEEITLTGLTLDLEITRAVLDDKDTPGDESDDELFITVKRNPGEGNLVGINFVISDGDNSVVVTEYTTLAELGVQTFQYFTRTLAVDEITSISVAPIFETSSGKEVTGEIKDTTTSSSGSLGTGDPDFTGTPGGNGGNGNGGCDPACVEGEECVDGSCVLEGCIPDCTGTDGLEGTADDLECGMDPTGCESCGTCTEPDVCEVTGQCVLPEDCTDTCETYEYVCGTWTICGFEETCPPGCAPPAECDAFGQCFLATYEEGGIIDNVWPPGAGIYFDDDALPQQNGLYYAYLVAFSIDDTQCYPIIGYSYTDAYPIAAIVEIALAQPLGIASGDTYEIWDSITDCTNALPVS